MKYKCVAPHPNLTVGKTYTEWAQNPNAYNAVVKNDLGQYEYLPRDDYFKRVKSE